MKKALAILGSPRKWGNAELLLDEFLKELKSKKVRVKKIRVSELAITPCTNCNRCLKTGRCVFKDDMNMVSKELKEADCIIVASPIYFTNLPGQLKILVDRCQPYWARNFVLKRPVSKKRKPGVFLSVCGFQKPTMFNCALRLIKVLYIVLGVDLYGKILVSGVDKKGDILKRKDELAKARKLAIKLSKEI